MPRRVHPVNLDLKTEFKRAIRVAQFDHEAMNAVSKDSQATRMALLFIFASTFAGGLGAWVFPIHYGPVVYRATLLQTFGNILGACALILAGIYVLNHLANRWFKGVGSFETLFRVVGYGYVVGLLYFVPMLDLLVSLWILVLLVKTLIHVKRLTPEYAVISLVVMGLLFAVFLSLFENLNPANLYGGLFVIPDL